MNINELNNNKYLILFTMHIYVEGNIGTGKTTFLSFLKKNIEHSEVVYEPVDEWLSLTDSDGDNILQKFYENQHRWSLLLSDEFIYK